MTKDSPANLSDNPHPKALYRKYRPTKLSDVIGQDQVTQTLKRALEEHNFSHAYLFIGPRGTGKTSVARILAHEINQFSYQVEDDYLDIIEIDAASNTGVDNIRELREKAIIAPTKGRFKVYIIDEIHMLTKSASNALLKTLEEPPEHVVFIMATTDAHKVPITISSRAQVYTFQLARPEVMLAHLRKISDQEHLDITDEALEIVVKRGGGSFRDSLSLLDQITSLTEEKITASLLNHALGIPSSENIAKLLQAYVDADSATLNKTFKALLGSGLQPELITSELISTIIDHPLPDYLPLLDRLTQVQAPFASAKLLLALLTASALPATQQTLTPLATTSNTSATSNDQTISSTPKSTTTLNQAPVHKRPPFKAPIPKPSERPHSQPSNAENSDQEPDSAPEQIQLTKPITAENFDWENYLQHVELANSVLAKQLRKVSPEQKSSALHLYPQHKFIKNILEKPNNFELLTSLLPKDFSLIVHEYDEYTPPKDDTLSQITAIMGNVQDASDDIPF